MKTKINRKKQHYLNRAPGSVLPGHCQKLTDDFHLFVCQRCPAEVAGSGVGGRLRVARHYFKRICSKSKTKIGRRRENLGRRRCKNISRGSSAGAEAPGRWRRFPLGFCSLVSSCLDDRGVAQVEVCWRRSS